MQAGHSGLPRVIQLKIQAAQAKCQNRARLIVGAVHSTLGRIDSEIDLMRGTPRDLVLVVVLDGGRYVLNAEQTAVGAALGDQSRVVQVEVEFYVLGTETAYGDLGDGAGVLG